MEEQIGKEVKLEYLIDVLKWIPEVTFQKKENEEVRLQKKCAMRKLQRVKRELAKVWNELRILRQVDKRWSIQEEVANVQTEILSDFTSAKELMDSMQKTVQQIVLECDGADEFRSQFRTLTNAFKQVLDNVEAQFTELMNKDREAIETAEKSNTTK